MIDDIVLCKDCRYWLNERCHRYAPRPQIGETRYEGKDVTIWPRTSPTDGCSEGKIKGAHE